MDMDLVEREMDCIAPYMRPVCRTRHCLWTQHMGRVDMGLVEREMDCIAPYMRPTCRLKRRLPHAKSPAVQRCHTN